MFSVVETDRSRSQAIITGLHVLLWLLTQQRSDLISSDLMSLFILNVNVLRLDEDRRQRRSGTSI